MKNLLLPRSFRILGWILFIPALILGTLIFFEICRFSWLEERIVNDIVIVGISLGSLFVVCSKEPVEDEMTQSIRLASLLNSLYAYVMLLVVSTIFIDGMEYFKFMSLNLVLFPLIYILLFRTEMRHYYKMSRNEEQD